MKYQKLFPPALKFTLKLFAFQFFIFSLFRLVFYFFTFPSGLKEITFSQKLHAFRMGFEFDMIIVCYILLIPFIFLCIHSHLKKKYNGVYNFFFFFLLILIWSADLVFTADIPTYKQFGTHLNASAFMWNDTPGFILGIVFGSFSYWGFLILFFFIAVPSYFFIRSAFRKLKNEDALYKPVRLYFPAFSFLALLSLLLIGSRGRLSPKSTTHEGIAVISNNASLNAIPLNPNFTLLRSLLHTKNMEYKVPLRIKQYISFSKKYLGRDTIFSQPVLPDTAATRFNVVVVIMESMSTYKMGMYGGKNLTPNFNSLIKESVFFNRFFSSGIHTFNGLFSTSSGYPSIGNENGMKSCTRKAFNSLGTILDKKGYDTYFFTTHDPHFDNMSGYFLTNNYKNIISQYDMPAGKALSTLGVPDHVLYDKFIDVINQRALKSAKTGQHSPFLSVMMTASDHGPWKIPSDIPFKPNGNTEQENATQYADWAIGYFMQKAKKQEWYNNTIFIFLGDHGVSVPGKFEMPITYHHIPFVVHKPSSFKADTLSNLGYQPDLTATVLGLLGENYNNETFGIDLFKKGHPYVVITADDKRGCIDEEGYFFYHLQSSDVKRLWKLELMEQQDFYGTKRKKADSLDYASEAILETAKYFLRKEYYTY